VYASQQQQAAAAGPSLAEVLTPEAVADFVKLPGMLEALQEHMPEEQRSQVRGRGMGRSGSGWEGWARTHRRPLPATQADLEALPRTAQFLQQLQGFSAAIRSGRIDLAQFGLDPKGLTTADFLEAVQALVDGEEQAQAEQGGDGAGPMDS